MASAKKKENWWEDTERFEGEVVEAAPVASDNWWDNDQVYEWPSNASSR